MTPEEKSKNELRRLEVEFDIFTQELAGLRGVLSLEQSSFSDRHKTLSEALEKAITLAEETLVEMAINLYRYKKCMYLSR